MKGQHYDLYRASMKFKTYKFTIEFLDLKGFAPNEKNWGQKVKKVRESILVGNYDRWLRNIIYYLTISNDKNSIKVWEHPKNMSMTLM